MRKSLKVFTEPNKLQKWCAARRQAGAKVALVPTMGYLHEGHLSLIAAAKRKGADEIVVSVFVNPVQFGPNEDYEKYPRDEKADLAKCRAAGATAVFFPTPANMYLDGHSTYITEETLAAGLCGARRPGHFRGVCTVVAKLFNLVHPHLAVFGQKDFQQAAVIKRMVRDLNFDLKIVVAPIVREPSGLARSSRNTYLSDDERARGRALEGAPPGEGRRGGEGDAPLALVQREDRARAGEGGPQGRLRGGRGRGDARARQDAREGRGGAARRVVRQDAPHRQRDHVGFEQQTHQPNRRKKEQQWK